MRNLNELDTYRVNRPDIADVFPQTDHSGLFKVMVNGRSWFIIATVDAMKSGKKMEHISISHRNPKKMPDWDTLTKIKDMFFLPEEECMQFFPKHSEYVNVVENCLHIWRPVGFDWDTMDFTAEGAAE